MKMKILVLNNWKDQKDLECHTRYSKYFCCVDWSLILRPWIKKFCLQRTFNIDKKYISKPQMLVKKKKKKDQ